MKLLRFFKSRDKVSEGNIYRTGKVLDFYQDSIEKIGRDQLKKLVEKGLSIPVFVV